jgi:hypothetical protein
MCVAKNKDSIFFLTLELIYYPTLKRIGFKSKWDVILLNSKEERWKIVIQQYKFFIEDFECAAF